MGFAPTWLRQVSPLLHKTTLITALNPNQPLRRCFTYSIMHFRCVYKVNLNFVFSHCFNYNSVSVLSVGLVDTWSISRMQSRALRPLSKPGSRICETTATATLTTASSGSLLHCYNTVTTQKHGRKPGTKCGGRPVQGVWGTEVPQWGPGAKPQ